MSRVVFVETPQQLLSAVISESHRPRQTPQVSINSNVALEVPIQPGNEPQVTVIVAVKFLTFDVYESLPEFQEQCLADIKAYTAQLDASQTMCKYCDAGSFTQVNSMVISSDFFRYTGEVCQKGHACGMGAVVNVSLKRTSADQVGHFKYNELQGPSIIYGFSRNNRFKLYEGEFLRGQMHGVVKEYRKDSSELSCGSYIFGQRHGVFEEAGVSRVYYNGRELSC